MVFTSLGHLINKEMLMDCHIQMDGDKAVGIDGVTKDEYGKHLETNLELLVERLKKKSYRPKPARLVEIPKENGKMRPLSIYSYEDKLVQEALRRILEAVFELMFYDEMMGFRPNRGCHKAIKKLNVMLERKPTSYVLDADIKGFFQHLDHDWIIRFVESRIKDPNIIRLVRRMLKAGILNNYEFEATEEGSGQGSVCSPIISCIYMHYVLIWWFKEVVTPKLRGYAGLVVYADDFVVTFQYKSDAEWFYEHLKNRMEHFGLSLEENKSRLIEFGRFAKERSAKQGTKLGVAGLNRRAHEYAALGIMLQNGLNGPTGTARHGVDIYFIERLPFKGLFGTTQVTVIRSHREHKDIGRRVSATFHFGYELLDMHL